MRHLLLFVFTFLSVATFANKSASEIYVDLQKVHSLKRVLYIAAHPDDENTRALAWFSLGEKAETAYLSLTRGDGGQNLIGDELSEDLGVLRTQELLAARSIDHARQYFTRAVDFGYSKSAKESLNKWGNDEILADVVLVIRKFKPDVIVTRFPPDKRAGHGHHTASALLAIEAFEKAADPNYMPAQVKIHGTWKTTALYWNTSVWWGEDISEKAKNNENYLIQDIGGYNTLLGMSYNEIGTLARSQHKCQGFGAIVERGERLEYFEHLAGKKLKDSFFENNKLSWGQFVSPAFESEFQELMNNFDFIEIENNVDGLIQLQQMLTALPSGSELDAIKKEKIALLNSIIINCLGLHIEVVTSDYSFVKDETVKANYLFTNRSNKNVQLIFDNGSFQAKEMVLLLEKNKTLEKEISFTNNKDYSTPYWLKSPFNNLFKVLDSKNLGKPESDPTFAEDISFMIDGNRVDLNVPITYKWRDPSYGERRRETISTPEYSATFDQKSIILKPEQKTTIGLRIHSFKPTLNTELTLVAPEGWIVSPSKINISTTSKHEELYQEITLSASNNPSNGMLQLKNAAGENVLSLTEIAYDHIPTQVIFKKGELKCTPINATIIPGKIAYIKGAGDAVPAAIEQLGFEVSVYEVADLATLNLSAFESVVLGIRIYNVKPELHNYDKKLFAYVNNGGNLVMQYNTASRNATQSTFGPSPFELSRNRVTEEDAAVTFLAPNHPIMTTPNKITQKDFEGWVQERGLYFANNWSNDYTPLFGWNDTGEEPVNGALIVAKHGKGRFIYTGISFFRELPNGVAGAYRLFANILSYKQ